MSRTRHHGDKAKQRLFNPWLWLQSTPSWWTRLTMNRPQRRAAHLWERKAAKTAEDRLVDIDVPPHGNKPHRYFW